MATIRYTNPSVQRFYGSIPNQSLGLELKRPDQVWFGDITYLKLGIVQSMNRPGKITDNAFIESFFHSMEADVFHGRRFEDDESVKAALKDYLPFYNSARLHSSLDYVSLATFEQQARRTGCP